MALPRRPAKKGDKPRAPIEPRPAGDEIAGRACPICQTQVVRGESVVACPACELNYHEECWIENQGCGAYGCAEAPETVKPKTDAGQVHWEGEKKCPQCRQEIKAQALVCMHCKAQFWTRDPISREQWEKREYSGDELGKVRNVMVLVFLASACGCFFPFMIAIDAHW
ncbi:MAG: RING finger protein, partial [Planctomycetota bacterium]